MDAPSRFGGKADLPPKRSQRETWDVAGAACRMIGAVATRVAWEDPEDLQHLQQIKRCHDRAWETAIAGLRRSGYTDRAIGEVLGVTRQAVEQRWPHARARVQWIGGQP